jgi:hypothetical protein
MLLACLGHSKPPVAIFEAMIQSVSAVVRVRLTPLSFFLCDCTLSLSVALKAKRGFCAV